MTDRDAYATGAAQEVENAITDLLGGQIARTITAERARHVLTRVWHYAEQWGRDMAIRELQTTEQVAALLGVTRARVWQLARARGVGWRIGRDMLFRPADVAALRDRRPGRPGAVQPPAR